MGFSFKTWLHQCTKLKKSVRRKHASRSENWYKLQTKASIRFNDIETEATVNSHQWPVRQETPLHPPGSCSSSSWVCLGPLSLLSLCWTARHHWVNIKHVNKQGKTQEHLLLVPVKHVFCFVSGGDMFPTGPTCVSSSCPCKLQSQGYPGHLSPRYTDHRSGLSIWPGSGTSPSYPHWQETHAVQRVLAICCLFFYSSMFWWKK